MRTCLRKTAHYGPEISLSKICSQYPEVVGFGGNSRRLKSGATLTVSKIGAGLSLGEVCTKELCVPTIN